MTLVEGKWKTVTFRMLTQSDVTATFNFLKIHFWPDEAITSSVGKSPEMDRDCLKNVEIILSQNLSFGAYDTKADKLLGATLISSKKKGSEGWGFEAESKQRQVLINFVHPIGENFDIFDLYNVTEYAEIRMLAVSREFRQQGLANEMFTRSLPFLKDFGLQVVKSFTTSPHSRAIAAKLGFQELARRYYREMEDLDGHQIHPETNDGFVTLVVVKL